MEHGLNTEGHRVSKQPRHLVDPAGDDHLLTLTVRVVQDDHRAVGEPIDQQWQGGIAGTSPVLPVGRPR